MEPSSPFRVPACPGAPLYQLSPDRINQQRLPVSPSLPNHLASTDYKHSRQSSDVASKVAFLNSLNSNTSPARPQSQSTHAALQRAILGREEAEASLSAANLQLAEAQIRERKISERVESLMEELQTIRERQVHERQVFEKEVRRARKDAFKSGSTLVKAQEDLKEARAELKTLRAEVFHERTGKEKAKQEAFERAYTLAGMMEEMEIMRDTLRKAEAERDAALLEQSAKLLQSQVQNGPNGDLDTNLKPLPKDEKPQENDVSGGEEKTSHQNSQNPKTPTEGLRKNRFERLLPIDSPENTPFITWGIHRRAGLSTSLEKMDIQGIESHEALEAKLEDLVAELRWEKKLRERADDMVHFLQIECQFKMCACRIAEQKGERFIHDLEYERKVRAESAERKRLANSTAEKGDYFKGDPLDPSLSQISTEEPSKESTEGDGVFRHNTNFRSEEPVIDHVDSTLYSKTPSRDPDRRPRSQFDLLELSPVKHSAPRPATAMGLITRQSPIRMVPHSPQEGAATHSIEELMTANYGGQDSTPRSTMTKSPSASPYPITPGFMTPAQSLARTVQSRTTTTMVPLRGIEDDDVFSPQPNNVPGTPISREAALAQIRARRDRARSLSLKTTKSAPGSARRGLGGGIRDVSAPGRF